MVEREDPPILPTTHAKIRIVTTANALFYDEGVHTVGVDRIIAEAGVTKATFYKYFRSKELLIVAYLQLRDQYVRDIVTTVLAEQSDPVQRLRALADAIAAESSKDDFRGCPFINATAQFSDPQHPVRVAITKHREWYVNEVQQLFREAAHPHPLEATDDYFLARDGAYASANLGDPLAAQGALHRAMERLIDQTVEARAHA